MLISGRIFCQQCKWNLDGRYPRRVWASRDDPSEGDTVFLRYELLDSFLSVRPYARVILVIHNTDKTFTEDDYKRLQPFVIKIYSVNCEAPSAIPIPLGFRDHQYTSHEILKRVRTEPSVERTIPVLLNFLLATNRPEREAAYNALKDKPFCVSDPEYLNMDYNKALEHSNAEVIQKRINFYKTLKKARFAVCPFGNGKDTHRVYECIFFGVIPIVKTSFLDRLYRQLPVWIVKDWSEITAENVSKYIPIRFEDYPLLKGQLEHSSLPPTLQISKSYLISSLV